MSLENKIVDAGMWFLAGMGFMLSLVGIRDKVVLIFVCGAIACILFVAIGMYNIFKE